MDAKAITGHEPINPLYSGMAIPQNKEDRELVEGGTLYSGLTIRQEFARAAMQGLLAKTGDPVPNDRLNYAIRAVRMADALIEALNRTTP